MRLDSLESSSQYAKDVTMSVSEVYGLNPGIRCKVNI